jgi:hypothetical protein
MASGSVVGASGFDSSERESTSRHHGSTRSCQDYAGFPRARPTHASSGFIDRLQALRLAQLALAAPQRLLGLRALDGDAREMRQLLDQIEMLRSGTARLAEIQRESPQRLSRRGKDRRRPAGRSPCASAWAHH